MKKTNSNLKFAGFLPLAVALCFAAPGAAMAKPKYEMKIASAIPGSASIWNREIDKIIRKINAQMKDTVEIRYYHSGKLGKEGDLLEQVRLGSIQAAGLTGSTLATIVPEVQIMELPYLFRDYAEAHYLVDNFIQPVIAKKLQEKGLKTTAFMENGFLQFLTPRKIERPEGFKGLKIGSWETPLYLSFWKALDANATPLATTEIISAYGQKLVDSGTNSIHAIATVDPLMGPLMDRSKYWIGINNHIYQAGIVVVNEKYWDKMPKDLQGLLEKELKALTSILREKLLAAEAEDLNKLKARGYNALEYSDKMNAPFIERSEAVYRQFEDKIGKDFIQTILKERDKYRREHGG